MNIPALNQIASQKIEGSLFSDNILMNSKFPGNMELFLFFNNGLTLS